MTSTNDIMSISESMDKIDTIIRSAVGKLTERAIKKADTEANYDLQMAKTIVTLKSMGEVDLDGVMVKESAASNVERIAKGVCHKVKQGMLLAELEYKNLIVGIDAMQGERNCLQSRFRHLDNK